MKLLVLFPLRRQSGAIVARYAPNAYLSVSDRSVLGDTVMPRWVFPALALAIGSAFAALQPAQAQPIDRWHYIDDDSVLQADPVKGLHGAGVIQSDQTFAMLYLGLPDRAGLVSVVLPTAEPADALSSILIKSDGERFERMLTVDELDIARVSEQTHAYSFPITDVDVGLFKAARSWQLQIADTIWTITLRGSRDAIALAERERRRQLEELAARPLETATETEDASN